MSGWHGQKSTEPTKKGQRQQVPHPLQQRATRSSRDDRLNSAQLVWMRFSSELFEPSAVANHFPSRVELESRTYVRCSVRERLQFFLRSVGRHGVIVGESARAVFFPLRRQKIAKKRVKSEHLCVRVSKKKSYGRRVSHFKSVRRVRKVKFAKIYY